MNVCHVTGIDGREYTFRMEQVICVICEPLLSVRGEGQAFENQVVLPGVVFNVRPNDAHAVKRAFTDFHNSKVVKES